MKNMVIEKVPIRQDSQLMKLQLDLMTYDIYCRYVLQPSTMIRMEQLVNLRNMMNAIDPSTYENDPEKIKRIRFIYRALEARLENNIEDVELIITYVNGGLSFKIDFLDYDHIMLNKNEIQFVNNMVSETLQYQFLYQKCDTVLDTFTRFKTTDFNNRANIIPEIEQLTDELKNGFRIARTVDNIVDMEFSLEEGAFENTIRDTYNMITNPSRRLVTGMQGLNEMLGGGFESSRFYLLLGTSGIGKSLTLLNIMYQIKRYNTRYKTKDPTKIPCVVLLTMENTVIETITRLWSLSVEGDLGMEAYTVDEVIAKLRQEGQLVISESSPINIVVKYRPNRSINTSYLYTMCDEMEDRGYEVICVIQDHLKRIRSVYNNQDLRIELGDVVSEMKNFAAEKNIPVISNTHLNREATKIVEEGLRKGNQDVGKLLGQSNTGESMLIQDNVDCSIMITLDFDKDGNRHMCFNLTKMRDKMINPRTYFAQPFIPGSTIRLVEDMGGVPQFKESLHMAPELKNNTIIKMSGASSMTNSLDDFLDDEVDSTNIFKKATYDFSDEEDKKNKVVIDAITFFDEMDNKVDDIIKDLNELVS